MPVVFAHTDNTVKIYRNEACGHCSAYVNEAKQFFEQKGFKVIDKFVINDLDARKELEQFINNYDIPLQLQGHMFFVINDNLVLSGHAPLSVVKNLFEKYPDNEFPEILIYQDSMLPESEIKSYKVMTVDGNVIEKLMSDSIDDFSGEVIKKAWWEKSVFTIVLVTGLLAGIHPCTISVLLFFMAFLFTIKSTRLNMFRVGGSYILGVFIAYFFIGLGIFKAVTFGNPHLAAKLAAVMVIILGLYNLKNYLWNSNGFHFGIPHASKENISELIHKASVPAAFLLGLFVGICSFGCTAGVYLSILGLLLSQPTQGFFYLVMYNILFILPLIAILVFASSKRIVSRMEKWELSEKKYIKLIAGAVMIALGLFILYGGVLH